MVVQLQAAALIADDVMDNGTQRRGQISWHALPGVGISALNDGLFLVLLVSKVLRKIASNTSYLAKVESLFENVILQTAYGQQQDSIMGMELNMPL